MPLTDIEFHEGSGGVAGFAKGGAEVKLAEDDGNTVLTYVADAQVGGKLAQIGSRLIDSTAKKWQMSSSENLLMKSAVPLKTPLMTRTSRRQ